MDQPQTVQFSNHRGNVTILVEAPGTVVPKKTPVAAKPLNRTGLTELRALLLSLLSLPVFAGLATLSDPEDLLFNFGVVLSVPCSLLVYTSVIRPALRRLRALSQKPRHETARNPRAKQRLVIEEWVTRSVSNRSTARRWHREAIQSFRVRERSEGSFDILASADDELVTLFKDLDEEEVKAVSTHLEAHLAPEYFAVRNTVRVIQGEQPGYREASQRTVEVQLRGERAVQRVRVGGHHFVEAIPVDDGMKVVARTDDGEVTLFEELDEDEANAVVAALLAEV